MALFRTVVGLHRRLSVRRQFGFAIALAALVVAGCATPPDVTVPDETPPIEPLPTERSPAEKPTVPPPASPAPADQAPAGFEWGMDGALVHSPSGAVFEQQYGDFVRQQNIQRYDNAATDVSVDYLWGARLALATIYVYPTNASEVSEKMLRAEYDRCMGQVYDHKTVTDVLAEWYLAPDSESELLPGHVSVFSVEEGVEFLSFLLLFAKSEWFVLYRISVPGSLVADGVYESIMDLPWAFDYGAIQ